MTMKSVRRILTIHGVKSLIKIPATLQVQRLRGGFSISFLSAQVFLLTWLTISYRCSCFPSLLHSVMCGAPRAAVSRYCWWYMNSGSAAALLWAPAVFVHGGKTDEVDSGVISSSWAGRCCWSFSSCAGPLLDNRSTMPKSTRRRSMVALFPPTVVPAGR